ncbi:hypothetical protein [Flavobacterium sp.]|uniref:hypothetical protein n=1 Tax=Flavobacterium sp. TaxID=239 RepID=UPI003D0FE4E7
MKKRKLLGTTLALTAFITTANAQSVGADWGSNYDNLLVNKDATNHWGQIRLQTNQKAFTFSNFTDRLALNVTSGTNWDVYGTEIFRVKENGDVGLGNVSNPRAELHFPNTMDNRKLILWQDADNDVQFSGFGINDAALRYQATKDHVFYNVVNESTSRESLRIARSGNVGIGGITTPEQNLHVKNNALISNLFIGDVGLGTSWASIANNAKKTNTTFTLASSNDGKYTVINKENTNDGYIGFRVGNQDKMVVSNSGKLGLGTITPNGELQFANNYNTKKIVLWEDASNDHQFYGFGTNAGTLRYQSNNDHVFYSATGATDSKETLRIFKNGGIQTDKVILSIGSFPDYVFEDTYKLMPLEEVATYINSHKHLPNIPSEKEMIASGLDVTKLSTKMVEKIEELTLYTIQQNDKIKSLEKMIESLMKRLDQIEQKTALQK